MEWRCDRAEAIMPAQAASIPALASSVISRGMIQSCNVRSAHPFCRDSASASVPSSPTVFSPMGALREHILSVRLIKPLLCANASPKAFAPCGLMPFAEIVSSDNVWFRRNSLASASAPSSPILLLATQSRSRGRDTKIQLDQCLIVRQGLR